MNKDQYLEELYIKLGQYDIDSPLKHVTEYDYIISDMLEESTIEDVINQLGTPNDLATSIAEEFEYEFKNHKQFEEPIYNRKKKYNNTSSYSVLAKIINVLFAICSCLFFLTYGAMTISLLIIIGLLGIFSIPTMIFLMLSVIAFSIFVIALYMLIYNFKNMITNRLLPMESEAL